MKSILRLLLITSLVSTLALSCNRMGSPAQTVPPYTTPLRVGSQQIFVEVVDNDLSRARGLSGRDQLTDQQGMLFDFRDTGIDRPAFWMKDMRFALDFIWIDDSKIIGITANAPVEHTIYQEDYTIYRPPGPVDAVLEVNADWADSHNVKVGDTIGY